jgi:hypothetical protein
MLKFQASVYGGSPDSVQPLPVTFDEATAALQAFERLFIEADGSFVWTGVAADGQAWQVDGNLIDRGDTLAYVELKGRCPQEQFDRLLAAFGWPQTPLTFQLPQRGVMLTEADFRCTAVSEAGAV